LVLISKKHRDVGWAGSWLLPPMPAELPAAVADIGYWLFLRLSAVGSAD
jgi:hypothetical protein